MDWQDTNWNLIVSALRSNRRVVPVIGESLQRITDDSGQSAPFVRVLARRMFATLSESERLAVTDAMQRKARPAADPSLHDLAVPFLASPVKFAERLMPVHDALLDEAMAQLFPPVDPPVEQRHPLRLLAEIRALPLYLTTTPDGLLKRVLARVRGTRDEDVRGFQLTVDKPSRATTADLRATYAWDLPPGWEPSPTARPWLYHLFGRMDDPDGSARFDVTEEDHFEMLCRLQSETWCPQQLLWELRPAHVLLLGQPLADWHARFFLRLLRGQRLAERNGSTTETLADPLFVPGPTPPHYQELAIFLDTFSEATRIYRDGPPEQFVRELHDKWQSIVQQAAAPGSDAAEPAPPADLAEDGVFISYQHHDLAAAERLTEGLRAAGVKVYLDKSRARDAAQPGLTAGSKWREALERNVKQAVFVLAIVSKNTQAGGFYRTEWAWAMEHDLTFTGMTDRGYLRPIIVDDSSMGTLRNVPKPFTEAHVSLLPEGQCNPAFLAEFLAAFELWRAKP